MKMNKILVLAGALAVFGQLNAMQSDGIVRVAGKVIEGPLYERYISQSGAKDARSFIESQRETFQKSPDKDWALYESCHWGFLDVVKQLVEEGASVNYRFDGQGGQPDYIGWTPLMKAADCDNVAVVKFLLSVGVQVDAEDEKGRTALILASDPCIVRFLLMYCANVHHEDKAGNTALSKIQSYIKVYRDDSEIAEFHRGRLAYAKSILRKYGT